MTTRIAFLESKTFTREASTQDPRCSCFAELNPQRTRRKTSVLTSGTYGRKSGYVPVELFSGCTETRIDSLAPLNQVFRLAARLIRFDARTATSRAAP